MLMGDFWVSAGLFAIPIFLLGGTALLFAILYVRSGGARHMFIAVGATAGTLLVSLLGTVAGFQMALRFLPDLAPDKRWLPAIGMMEAMNDLVLGLIFATVVFGLLTYGAVKSRREPELERSSAAAGA